MKLTAAALLAVVLLAGCSSTRTETFPNGSTYTGEFKDGWRHGQGTYTYPDGGTYTGVFKDGRPKGIVTERFPDGATYRYVWDDGTVQNN